MSTELKRNLDTFKEAEPGLKKEHLGRTALLHDGKIVAIYNDSGDAYSIGCEKFGLGNFSVEKIGASPLSLGFHTIAVGSSRGDVRRSD